MKQQKMKQNNESYSHDSWMNKKFIILKSKLIQTSVSTIKIFNYKLN